jgi:hypothetical protein
VSRRVEFAGEDEPAIVVQSPSKGLTVPFATSQSRSAQASRRKRSWLTRITAPV